MFHQKIIAAALLIALPFAAFPQFTLSGKVKIKDSKEFIPGATISIDNTFIAAQTYEDGSFQIENLKKGTYIIHISYIGFQKRTDTVEIVNNKSLVIELAENTVLMDEIIVSSTRVV